MLRRVIHQAKPEHYADCVTTLRQLDALLMGRLVQGAAQDRGGSVRFRRERYLSVEEVCVRNSR
ncbi:MAG: hypothetical protein U0231_12630 [Nitrospiraceae bacterium]